MYVIHVSVCGGGEGEVMWHVMCAFGGEQGGHGAKLPLQRVNRSEGAGKKNRNPNPITEK